MRRIVSIVLAAAILCLAMTACGSRQKTDLSKATTIADLKGAVIAGQAGTFHLDVIDQIDGVEKKSYPDFYRSSERPEVRRDRWLCRRRTHGA